MKDCVALAHCASLAFRASSIAKINSVYRKENVSVGNEARTVTWSMKYAELADWIVHYDVSGDDVLF